MLMVVDASVMLSAYFPDEDTHLKAQTLMRDYALDMINLIAPVFARYEIINSCHVAARRGRFPKSRACEIADEIISTEICRDEELSCSEIMEVSEKYGISIYDGIYVAMAGNHRVPLITADRKLYEKVRQSENGIIWIGDYRSRTDK
jgi:predicted nucleic acid-binding protein